MRSATAPADGLRPRPLFTVTIGIDPFNHLCQTAAGTVIAPGLLIPYLSDADIERIVYDPPNRRIEASWKRSFTGAVRRIIDIRDGHCQHPGCDEPAVRCDADHITPRNHGGITCLCNGQLLCAYHNRTYKAAADKAIRLTSGSRNDRAAPLPPPRTPHPRPRRHRHQRQQHHRPQPRPTRNRLTPRPSRPHRYDSRASTRAPVLAHQYRPQSHRASRTVVRRSRSSSWIE